MKIWLIECRTGCTCCSYDNHYRGPYKSKEDAERRIEYYRSKGSKFWPVASQYASRGSYSIEEHEVELLSGDRFIVDDNVHRNGLKLVDVKEDGTISDNESEWFKGDY